MRVRSHDCEVLTTGVVREVPGAGAAVEAVRYAKRQDDNHKAIVDALKAHGWVVTDTSRVGGGFPDLVIERGALGICRFVEIKDGSKPASARKLTPAEMRFHRWMRMVGVTVQIVESVEDALAVR